MERFLHLDRLGTLRAGQVIGLESLPAPQWFGTLMKANLETADEVLSLALRLFPQGLTRHGTYLFCTLEDRITECVFELVRRADYPDRPSRFQSLFALRDLGDLLEFAKVIRTGGCVWEVQGQSWFRGDMAWLSHQGTALQWLYRAHCYWEEKPSARPRWEYLLAPPITVTRYVGPVPS